MKRTLALVILSAFSLSACASEQGAFPSLERRPFESVVPAQQTDNQPILPATKLSSILAEKLSSIQARHNAAASAYANLLPAVRDAARAAAGSGAGNENWAAAHVALSRLDKSRADSVSALAELDILVTEQEDMAAKAGAPSVVHLLTPTQSKIADAVEAQNSEIKRLSLLIGL